MHARRDVAPDSIMTVYKMLEVVGTSNTSVSDAIHGAVHRTAETMRGLQWFEVKEIRGRIGEGDVAEYQVKVEIGFTLEAADERTGEASDVAEQETTASTRSAMAQAARKAGERGRTDLAEGFREKAGKSERS